MITSQIKKLNIPTTPGCYQFFNARGTIVYIGKATNLKSRVLSYWQKSAELSPVKKKMVAEVAKVAWVETDSEIEALLLESNLIKKYQPPYNVLLRDDKRFIYIKVSLEDEIPGVFLTREIDKAGKYFGPFVSSQAARETVRALRKIFPYCATRRVQNRPCFYCQIGRCLGICAGKISQEEYMRMVIRPLVMFLSGKKGQIINNLKKEIRNWKLEIRNWEPGDDEYVVAENKIKATEIQLKSMKYVLENAKVLSVSDKYANDVVELAKILGLPKRPERIEGYDIANIFGREAVGSMAVFSSGEADKSEYRKFKIKIGQGQANDAGMLAEVLERRFGHAPLNKGGERGLTEAKGGEGVKYNPKIPLTPFDKGGKNWPLPDLIVIDGGKAQLNAALKVLKKRKLEIPLLAISKGLGLRSSVAPDKIFFPGQAKPLELPLASPALHLIKRVRDEAHRFAISYHRKLRSRARFDR